MSTSFSLLNVSEAARRLGVSAKALRLYEQRGLVLPRRTAVGYRVYGAEEMARAGKVVALRSLGLSHSQVTRVLEGNLQDLECALAAHEISLDAEVRKLTSAREKVRRLRADLVRGEAPAVTDLAGVLRSTPRGLRFALDLPWPWGGERFELDDVRPINYIVGPLGSGKTRFAQCLAETLPGAVFVGLDREEGIAARLVADAALQVRVDQALAWLVDEGAIESSALLALLAALETEGPTAVVVDMVEQGLDQASQEALIAHLRQRARAGARPLFLMTRSTAILDLAAVGADEGILLCPANHSPPIRVAPYPGAVGYEAVATCLASPDVRARTSGMVAVRTIGNVRREGTPGAPG